MKYTVVYSEFVPCGSHVTRLVKVAYVIVDDGKTIADAVKTHHIDMARVDFVFYGWCEMENGSPQLEAIPAKK